MTNRMGKFCKPLSIGLCNKHLAFGNWHDCANYLTLIL
jgi:hypothetical protein